MDKKMSIFNSLKAYMYSGILKTKNKKQQVEKKKKKKITSWKIEEKEETMAQMRKEGQYLSVGLHVEIAPNLHKSKTHLVKMLFGGKGQDP